MCLNFPFVTLQCRTGNSFITIVKLRDYHDNGIYPSNTPKHYKHSIVRVELQLFVIIYVELIRDVLAI